MSGFAPYPSYWFATLMTLLFMVGWLAGCTSPPTPVTGEPESAAVPTFESSPVAVAVPPTPVEPEAVAPASCEQAVTTYNVRTDLGLEGPVQVAYLTDTTVEIAGWGQSPLADDADPPLNRFRRHMLDLGSGIFTPVTSLPLPPDLTICTACTREVLEVLPDGETFLVAIQGSEAVDGIWLYRARDAGTTRLVSFMPYDSLWGYAADGSMLWLEYSLPEYGRTLVLVHLDETVRLVQPESEELDPTRYRLAFSPLARTVLSYPLADENPEAPPEAATYDVSQDPAVLLARERQEAVVRVFWDFATTTYLVVEAAGKTVRVTTLGGDPRVVIGLEALQQMNANIDSVAEWRTSFTASNTFALAPDDSSFIIADGRGRLTVFGCDPAS
jgi:hypothetical protein